jgi:N-acyl-D-amino-acid deacylase
MIDVLITGGDVYDGLGGGPERADVAIVGDRVAEVKPGLAGSGPADGGAPRARVVIDAAGRAVAPGFINILSHSNVSILRDPRSLGELTQGVTTEIFGEGSSMGPLTPALRAELAESIDPIEVRWTRLSEYLRHVQKSGTSQNVGSFIGGGTLRANVVGHGDRPAEPAEVDRMRGIVAEEMADGALGIASALIYAPGSYASTEELTAVCRAVADYDGCYASHLRDEGAGLLGAIGEFLAICRGSGVRGEVFHLKAAGRDNWPNMGGAISLLESARAAGDRVTADVYPYTASATGLYIIIPGRYHDGGQAALFDRLADPVVRREIRRELEAAGRWADVRGAEEILLLQLDRPDYQHYQGRSLADVAAERGTDPLDTAMDLMATDRTRVECAFMSMSEDNLRSALGQPWVGISSDGASMAPEGVFLRAPTHPRAYGSFARVLGHYVRDGVLTLADAVHKMSGLPAATLGLDGRGVLRAGSFADVVVFDPATVADQATFARPHQLSVGVTEVLVNGEVAVAGGESTGRLAGRALAGRGATAHG